MDENSESPGKARRGPRSSLVERAAQKMVADHAALRRNDIGAAAAPAPAEPMPRAASEPNPALVVEAATGEVTTNESDEESLQMAAVAGSPLQKNEAPTTRKRQKHRSKVAKINVTGLMARNILTPQTKRNRTLEEFRLIKRMVLSRRWDVESAPGNTIVVTSALPSEGKTTTAINLAMSIAAEEDLRVLLVDADFIKPDALRQLGVSASKGLIDVIEDPRMDIADVMIRTDIEKLSLIPSGQLHDRCTELLASARMDELITEMASRYEDRILIFDSPPVLATSEAVTLASHMGQIVFVVQAGRTKRESVTSALELLGDRPNLGLVLNRTTARFGNTEFGAYNSSYYYAYGSQRSE